jgi:arginine/ornithine N-succinyltransferase beta subunit
LFFNVALKNALKEKIGQKVLARIGQGTAKPGKSAPWVLIDATGNADDLAKANAFIGGGNAKASAPAAPQAPIDTNNLPPEVQALLNQLGAKQV